MESLGSNSDNESMTRLLVFGLLEAALNEALQHDPEALALLAEHRGKTVRIRTDKPDFSVYVTLAADGVHVFDEHEGPISARVRAPAAVLARYLFGYQPGRVDDHQRSDQKLNDPGVGAIRSSGDAALLQALVDVGGRCNIWQVCQRLLSEWLPEHTGFSDVVRLLREYDPAWIDRLQHMPELVQDVITEIKRQADVQQQQLLEIRLIKQRLDAERRKDCIAVLMGLMMMGASLLGSVTLPVVVDWYPIARGSFEALLLMVVGAILVVPRVYVMLMPKASINT